MWTLSFSLSLSCLFVLFLSQKQNLYKSFKTLIPGNWIYFQISCGFSFWISFRYFVHLKKGTKSETDRTTEKNFPLEKREAFFLTVIIIQSHLALKNSNMNVSHLCRAHVSCFYATWAEKSQTDCKNSNKTSQLITPESHKAHIRNTPEFVNLLKKWLCVVESLQVRKCMWSFGILENCNLMYITLTHITCSVVFSPALSFDWFTIKH